MVHVSAYSYLTNLVPTRFVIGLMVFLATTFAYMLSFNFSINLLAMVQHTDTPAADGSANDDDDTVFEEMPDYGPRYPWTTYQQSLLLGAYFYGNVLTVPAGLFVERFGHATAVICASFAVSTALAASSPLAAAHSFAAMFGVRFAMGVAQGLLYPAYTKLIAAWSPPAELGLFTSALMGSNIGTVLAWCMSGALIESFGWAASFYVNASVVAAFTVCCAVLVYDSPGKHPRIAIAERTFIEKSLQAHGGGGGGGGATTTTTAVATSDATGGEQAAASNRWPPLAAMARSAPFWSLFAMQFGNSWGMFFLVTTAPKFLNEILGFHIGSTGVLASLPYVLRTVVAFGVAWAAQRLERRFAGRVSVTCWRRVYSVLSHVIPGLLLLAIPAAAAAQSPYLCVAIITLSFGLNGAVTVVTTTNYHDLAPNYACTLNALINGLGNSAGFLSPLLVAYYTQERNTIAEWRAVFAWGAVVYVMPAALFALWGSGEVQPWNEPATAKSVEAAAAEQAVPEERRANVVRASAGAGEEMRAHNETVGVYQKF